MKSAIQIFLVCIICCCSFSIAIAHDNLALNTPTPYFSSESLTSDDDSLKVGDFISIRKHKIKTRFGVNMPDLYEVTSISSSNIEIAVSKAPLLTSTTGVHIVQLDKSYKCIQEVCYMLDPDGEKHNYQEYINPTYTRKILSIKPYDSVSIDHNRYSIKKGNYLSNDNYEMLLSTDTSIYLMRTDIKQLSKHDIRYVILLDSNLTLVNKTKIKLINGTRKLRYVKHMIHNKKVYFFGESINLKDSKYELHVCSYNLKENKVNEDFRLVSSVDFVGQEINSSARYAISHSYDKQNIVIQTRVSYNSHGEIVHYKIKRKPKSNPVTISLLDKNMRKKWQGDLEIPFTSSEFLVRQIEVKDFNNIFILGKIKSIKLQLEYNLEYSDVIIQYKMDNKNTFFRSIPLENYRGCIMKMFILPDNNIQCIGFYSTGNWSTVAFNHIVNFETRIVEVSTKKKISKIANPNCLFKDLKFIRNSKGELYMTTEYKQMFTFKSTTYDPNMPFNQGSSYSMYYNYYDIVVAKMGIDNKIEWIRGIPKAQKSEESPYASYTQNLLNDTLQIITNNHIELVSHPIGHRNLILTELESIAGRKKTVIQITQIDPSGQMIRNVFDNSRKLFIIPKVGSIDYNDKILCFIMEHMEVCPSYISIVK